MDSVEKIAAKVSEDLRMANTVSLLGLGIRDTPYARQHIASLIREARQRERVSAIDDAHALVCALYPEADELADAVLELRDVDNAK